MSTVIGCDGLPIDPHLLRAFEVAGQARRASPRHFLTSDEDRTRDLELRRRDGGVEDRIVAAWVTIADRIGDQEFAVIRPVEGRSADPELTEALRLVADHRFDPERLPALRSLAESRHVPLAEVLRAALRGDLADIVRLPPAPK